MSTKQADLSTPTSNILTTPTPMNFNIQKPKAIKLKKTINYQEEKKKNIVPTF